MPFDALDLLRDALLETLLLSAPVLVAGLLVGLLISIGQAVTQIQEQTLSFVPKIVAMLVVAALLMGWLAQRMVEFATDMFAM